MKYIIFVVMLSMLSFNTFATGENKDEGCGYCIPCKKVVCKGNRVEDGRGSRKDIRTTKQSAKKNKKSSAKKA